LHSSAVSLEQAAAAWRFLLFSHWSAVVVVVVVVVVVTY
jgi:hypothetical protein